MYGASISDDLWAAKKSPDHLCLVNSLCEEAVLTVSLSDAAESCYAWFPHTACKPPAWRATGPLLAWRSPRDREHGSYAADDLPAVSRINSRESRYERPGHSLVKYRALLQL